jgi:hypothetical protein
MPKPLRIKAEDEVKEAARVSAGGLAHYMAAQ